MPAWHRADQEFVRAGSLGDVPLATFGGRAVARLCDLAILFVPTFLVAGVVLGGSGWTVLLLVAAEFVVYDAVLMPRSGSTPGKRVARIKVVRRDSGKPVLDRAIQARIGDKLRAMYGELSEQPVPDRFVAILDRLGKD